MARKKDVPIPRSAASRSSASIFANIDSSAELGNLNIAPVQDQKEKPVAEDEEPEEPVDAKFPLNLIYEFQDFLNAHLTVRKGFEFMCCLYICQIFYLHLSAIGATDVMYAVGFNILGALIAMYMSHRSQVKKYEVSPDSLVYPKLPSFNIIYSFLIPFAFFLLYSDYSKPFFQVNLSLTNFAISSLNPVAKALSAFVYYYMFNDNNTIEFVRFVQVIWLYYTVDYTLSQWNTRTITDREGKTATFSSLDPTEIHLIAVLMINLLLNFNVPNTDNSKPLIIMNILTIALVGATGVSFPLYYFYTSLEAGALRSLVSILVVSSFGATFYSLSIYLFLMKVEKMNAVQWLFEFITRSQVRSQFMITWISVLALAIPVVFFASHKDWITLNIRRKVWHFLIAGSLAYPLTQEPTFTAIAVVGSIFVFIAIEFLRGTRLTFVGGILNDQLKRFQDFKDSSGPLNLSYIYLLAGVSLPLIVSILLDDVVSLRSYIGLVTLGVGDSFASIIGRRFGKRKWAGGSRTFEGTFAFVVSTFLGFLLVDAYLLPESSRVHNWENVLIVSLIGGAVEGASTMNDNVLIPCISLITHDVVCKVFK